MTERQKQFYKLRRAGHSVRSIAKEYSVNTSTVYRTIARAEKHIWDAERFVSEMKSLGVEDDHADFGD